MREVAGAIVAIVCVLVCVFLPVAFLGGIAGVLYRQFAVTVALSVVLSGFVALTLTPTLCALMLRPHAPGDGGRLAWLVDGFGRGFGHVAAWHGRVVRWLLDHPRSAAAGFAGIVLANGSMSSSPRRVSGNASLVSLYAKPMTMPLTKEHWPVCDFGKPAMQPLRSTLAFSPPGT